MTTSKGLSALDTIINNAKILGSLTLADGTQLIGRVPHVGPDAWLHVLFAGLDEADIAELETRAARQLPSDYRQFMREHNGLSLFSGALYVAGLRRDFRRANHATWQPFALEDANVFERLRDAPADCVFIGGYKADGSRLYMSGASPKVFRCERSSIRPVNEWPNLRLLLNHEAERLAEHFDALGRRRDASTGTAPTEQN